MPAIAIIPTFNERDNIEGLLNQIFLAVPEIHVLVVDDLSKDGTIEIVRAMAKERAQIHVLSRSGPRGRGLAGVAGFQYALNHGFDPVLEMDADFSHNPNDIPKLLNASKQSEIVIGSRFVSGGRDLRQSLYRRILSRFANAWIRLVSQMPIQDCTSGFRCFSRCVLISIDLQSLTSTGPSVVFELLGACLKKNFTIREIPIEFNDRKHGASKLDPILLIQTFFSSMNYLFK